MNTKTIHPNHPTRPKVIVPKALQIQHFLSCGMDGMENTRSALCIPKVKVIILITFTQFGQSNGHFVHSQ